MNTISSLKTVLPSISSVLNLKKETDNEFSTACPKCGGTDRFRVWPETQRFWCHNNGCGWKGDIIDFHEWREGTDKRGLIAKYLSSVTATLPPVALALPVKKEKVHRPPVDIEKEWNQLLINKDKIIRYLKDERMIDQSAVESALNADNLRYFLYSGNLNLCCSFRDLNNRLLTYQKIFKQKEEFKKYFTNGHGTDGFFNAGTPFFKASTVVLVEAVFNALSIAEVMPGVCCLAIGSTAFIKKISEFKTYPEKKFVCFFDCDKSGNDAIEKTKQLLPAALTVSWPEETPDKTDVNDLLKQGHHDQIKSMIRDAKPINGPPYCYWYEKTNEKTGEISLAINEAKLQDFLLSRGFRNTKINDKKIIVRIQRNIVETVEDNDIRNILLTTFFDELPEQVSENCFKEMLRQVLIKGINVYIQSPKLDTLRRVTLDFVRDTKTATYFFFKNGVIEVTASGPTLKQYSDLTGVIWKDSIIPREIVIDGKQRSDYMKFLQNVCRKADDKIDYVRYAAAVTMHGYLLNGYNNPAYPKAVILTDGNLDSSPIGGTGKGIIFDALAEMRPLRSIDGKTTDFSRSFSLQNIAMNTRLIVFEDVQKGFNFELFFSGITDGYEIEQKFEKRFKFSQKDNPKTIITTNYAIGGTGNSHERRKFEFELYPYYSKTYTPEMDFGILFDDWNDADEQWNLFYNFMFLCSREFHDNDSKILTYSSDTLEMKKLIQAVGIEFVEFMDGLDLRVPIMANVMYEQYKASLSSRDADWINQTKFGLKLNRYCETKKLTCERDDRWNGRTIRYYVFTRNEALKTQ